MAFDCSSGTKCKLCSVFWRLLGGLACVFVCAIPVPELVCAPAVGHTVAARATVWCNQPADVARGCWIFRHQTQQLRESESWVDINQRRVQAGWYLNSWVALLRLDSPGLASLSSTELKGENHQEIGDVGKRRKRPNLILAGQLVAQHGEAASKNKNKRPT